jgi:excisionase family DNA binding protein
MSQQYEGETYVTASEARVIMDVSKTKLAKMLKTGELPFISDPRDQKVKLIKRSDIDAWLAKAVRPPHKPQRRQEDEEQDLTRVAA